MKFVILTTTPNEFSPTKLKEAIEAAGHDTILLDPDKCYIHIGPEPYVSHEGKKITEADVLIPRFSDENAEYKLAIINHFESMGALVINPANSVRLANNKLDSQIFLFKNGFKTPKSAMLTAESQLDFAFESLDTKFPIIIKTLFGRGGVGVMKVDSHASMKSVVQVMLDRGVKFVIQEFIENKGACRIMTIGGKYVASMFRAVDTDKDFRTNSGQGSKYETFKPSAREIEVCEKIAELTGINFCAVDYLVDDSGEPVIFEFNSSPGFETIGEANPDLDVAKLVIEYCIKAKDKDAPKDVDKEEPKDLPVEEPKVEIADAPKEVEQPISDPDVIENDGSDDEIEVDAKDETPSDDKAENLIDVEVDMTDDSEGDGIIGVETHVIIKRFNNDEPILARVDTGATLSSIHGSDIELNDGGTISFLFNNIKYKCWIERVAHIRSADGGRKDRPVIKFDIMIDGNLVKDVEFSVSNRGEMKFDMLIGRNALKNAELIVDPKE